MIKGIQIYYDSSQENYLNPGLIPYFNPPKFDPCLENTVIKELILRGEHKECDYFGVFSWKFEKKHARSLNKLIEEIKKDEGKHDVYTFFSLHTKPNLWEVAEKWHKGIIEVTKEVFLRTDLYGVAETLEEINMPAIYQNAHFSRPDIYEKYVVEWLIPFMYAMKDEEIQRKLNVDSGYKTNVSKAHLKEVFGFPYYTLHPFVLERLYSTFLAYHDYKVKQIV